MVQVKRPRLVLLQGGKAEPDMGKSAAKAHGDPVADCMIKIFMKIEEMANRTASPKVFRARANRHFPAPTAKSEHERRRQAEGLMKRLERFEQEFNDYMRRHNFGTLPAEKIVAVVEQMVDCMGRSSSVREGWKRPPPNSA